MLFDSIGARVRRQCKRLAESALHSHIVKAQRHGINPWRDIACTGFPVRIVLDVGANVGQTAERVRNEFHDAVIHSFEPVAASFEQLERTARRLRVCAHRLALGSSGGTATIGVCASSPRSSIALADHALKTEVVEMTTVDALFERLGLSRIDVLKIDTEGHDLEILRGAVNALDRRSIEFILAEVGLGRTGIHVPFDEVRDFVAERGFVWFGLYDQTPTRSGPPDLRYGNALFALGH